MEIPKGYIHLFIGKEAPVGWRLAPELEVGEFPNPYSGTALEKYQVTKISWEQAKKLVPDVHYIIKL